MARKRNKEYYAVISGRIDKPTIFSSWGHAHPRVTGCDAVHAAFVSIEKARDYMRRNGVSEHEEVIEDTALDTTPKRQGWAFYTVAYGMKSGIRRVWWGETGALEEIHEISGACHKRFNTEAQAKAFIEDWKEAFAEVVRREVKEGLDRGLRPRNMNLSIEGLLHRRGSGHGTECLAEQFDAQLRIDEH